jgi:hypothetical protein
MPKLQRKSDIFFSFLLLQLLLIGLMLTDAAVRRSLAVPAFRQRLELVRALSLTDLALFNEARYTRHPSMADRHAPFQEHPLSLEHFPSGSIVPPPIHLRSSLGR